MWWDCLCWEVNVLYVSAASNAAEEDSKHDCLLDQCCEVAKVREGAPFALMHVKLLSEDN